MDINLTLINNSNDHNNSEYVIFQKNVATNFNEVTIAWQVIKNLGTGDRHPFVYPMTFEVGMSDSWGNFSSPMPGEYGNLYAVTKTNSGNELVLGGNSVSSNEVDIRNDLEEGSINGNIYKDRKLLATKTGISPGEKASFSFKPILFIGVVSQLVQGEAMNSAITSAINTELSLEGVASADIVITGGGVGQSATEFTFTLENVVMA